MPRIEWIDLPPHVRFWVEEQLGASVIEHRSQPGGYSPGTADRLLAGNGRRAFLKAVHPSLNPDSPDIHRSEARVLERMPDGVPVPRLIDWYDAEGWVALLVEDVEARHPVLPWRADELDATLAALRELGAALSPNPVPGLPMASAELGGMFEAWSRWAGGAAPDDLDPWLVDRLPDLVSASERTTPRLDGDTLTHHDLRADNLLIMGDGSVRVIDWPWAMPAAPWLDPGLLLIEVITSHATDAASPDPDDVLARVATDYRVDEEVLVDLLASILAYFEDAWRRPDPPGLPTLRAFQKFQGDALRGWLQRRWP